MKYKLLDINNGNVLHEISVKTDKNNHFEILEQAENKLFLKQEHNPLQIIDILSQDVVEVPVDKFKIPSGVVFLQQQQLFVAYSGTPSLWSFAGMFYVTDLKNIVKLCTLIVSFELNVLLNCDYICPLIPYN
jgi:hypothetical protein